MAAEARSILHSSRVLYQAILELAELALPDGGRHQLPVTYEIETERLRLRPLANRDLYQIHQLWIDAHVRRYLWDGKVISRSRAQQEISQSKELFGRDGFGIWVLLPKDREPPPAPPPAGQRLVGFCGLHHIEESNDVELLYGLDPAHWGTGYATESSEAVLRRAFEVHNLEQVLARTDLPNEASVRVMERLGMTYLEHELVNGLDTLTYAITRKQFLEADAAHR